MKLTYVTICYFCKNYSLKWCQFSFFFRKSSYTADEVLQILGEETDDSDDDNTEINIAFVPPQERPEAVSDEDSDLSDGEVEGIVNHLPGRVLRSEAVHHGLDGNEGDNDETSVPLKKLKPSELEWSKDLAVKVIRLRSNEKLDGNKCVMECHYLTKKK
jgi:hypothetical protein